MKLGFTQIKTPKVVLASATAIALFSLATPAYADQNANDNSHSNVDISSVIQDAMTDMNQAADVSNSGTANVSSGGGTANSDVNSTFNFSQTSGALGGDTLVTADAGAVGGNAQANGAGITQNTGATTATGAAGTGTGAAGTSTGGAGSSTANAGADNGASAGAGSVGVSCDDPVDSDCLPSGSGGGAAASTGDSGALGLSVGAGGDSIGKGGAGIGVGGDGKAIGGDNSALNLTKADAGAGIAVGGYASANGAGKAVSVNKANVNAPVVGGAKSESGPALGIGNASYTGIAQAMRLRFNW